MVKPNMAVKWHSAVTAVTIGNNPLTAQRWFKCFAADFKQSNNDTKLRVQDVKKIIILPKRGISAVHNGQ